MGGTVNAEATATISLNKNKINALLGKGLIYLAPKAWAKDFSFNKLIVVLIKNVIVSLTKAGSTALILIWSHILEVA